MRSCNLIFVPLGALVALAANADVTAKTPRIAAAQKAGHVISHAAARDHQLCRRLRVRVMQRG